MIFLHFAFHCSDDGNKIFIWILLIPDQVKTGLVYQGPKTVFDPCDHFMDPFTWKGRGYHKDQNRYNVKVVSSHAIYYVVNECFKRGMNQDDWQVNQHEFG